jgi:hypothetical protein
MKYSFNINKMILWLMPEILIQPVHVAWLITVLAPLNTIYTTFINFKDDQLKAATITSSVIRLTKALWDQFDPTNAIYIIHPEDYMNEAYIFLQSEGAALQFDYLQSENHVPQDFDFLEVEYGLNYDFVVRVPIALQAYNSAIYAFVKRYSFSSLTFTIQNF